MASRSRQTQTPSGSSPAPRSPGAPSARQRIFTVALVCVPLFLCVPGITATVLLPALRKAKIDARARFSGPRCSNNLRQLGLAAIQYSDDKRFFPHVERQGTLDGGVDTNASTKKTRALLFYGYHDDPDAWICPASYDQSIPTTAGRSWFWQGLTNPTIGNQGPIADGAPDPTLEDTDELSYGWTRKGMNSNVRSTALLAADRAVQDPAVLSGARPVVNANQPVSGIIGNHATGWNVLRADAMVEWFDILQTPYPGVFLTGTSSPSDGYLGLKIQADPSVFGR